MNRISVKSSNLASVGYDELAGILEIEFHSGGIYQYFGVPKSIYDGLMQASSKGRYHFFHIKFRYKYKRIR